jgi:cell division protease FtsH
VRNLVDFVYGRTKDLLIKYRDGLEKVALKLLEKEVLFQSDLEEILGKRPFEHRTAYDKFVNGPEAAPDAATIALATNDIAEHPATNGAETPEPAATTKE